MGFCMKCFRFLLAGLLVLGMSACQGHTEQASSAPSSSAPSSEAETVEQTLVIGENVDLGGLDPSTTMSSFIRFLIFDGLVEMGYDYEQVPGLATSWEMSPDGKTWTFQLREGVQFHDGEPWNSQAAQINFQQRIDGGRSGVYQSIASMETPDEYTFVVHLSEPLFTFASDIAIPTCGMVSPKAFDENHNVTAAIGTGPFQLESWTKDVEFTMTANPNFYEGAPQLQKLIFKVIPDGNARAMALESGEIDMMSGRNALTSLEALRQNPEIQILKTMGQTSEMVQINTFDPVMSSVELRQAVAAACDFPTAVSALLTDLAEPAQGFFSPVFGEFVSQEAKLPAYDPQKAVELLAGLGYGDSNGDGLLEKDGQTLTLELLVDGKNEEDKALSTVMQDQLKQVGIDLQVTMLDVAALKEQLSAHDYQMAMQGQNYIPADDPSIHYRNGYYHSKSFYNLYSTPQLDAQVDQLMGSLDKEERLVLHHQLQVEITEQVPVIMMFHRNNIILANQHLAGFQVAKGTWQIYKGLEQAHME